MADRPTPSAVALVLGASVHPDGSASPSLKRRALTAAALWHDGTVGMILASGAAAGAPRSEAEVIRDLCIAAQVPGGAIVLETTATSTAENIRQSLPILRALGAGELPPVVLVTDLYHQPRARLVAGRSGLAPRSVWPPVRQARLLPFLKASLREIPAFLLYWLRGDGRLRPPD